MKVLFVSRLFHNVSGGVERCAIALMNELCRRGHEVELLSWDSEGSEAFYPLDPAVVWHRLNMGDARVRAGLRLRLGRQIGIRRLVQGIRPDVIVAFQQGPFIATATATVGLGIPVIAAERNAPQRFDHIRAGRYRSLIFYTFQLATRITVQWDDYISDYPQYLRARIVSIPNPVLRARMTADAAGATGRTKRLLSVGRLSYQKNQSVLVEAFAMLADRHPDWRLTLVGAGEDEPHLKHLASVKGLGERVDFLGATTEVERAYLESHLFCLTSRWEGFPNAMAEAMAHGLPAIGFSECAGVAQLIDHGLTGLLALGNGTADTLADAMHSLMESDQSRARMGRAAQLAMARFAPAAVFDRWENLFKEVAGQR